ncbi:MAG TPA: hypothetical protein VHN15_10710 [Thermoanaerobaculia bacterium]|nr:hypothetical protein [Thermoanaerobaculia bacterium]
MKNLVRLSLAVALLLVSFFSAPKEAHACDTCIQNCLYGYCGVPGDPECLDWAFPICEDACCR